MSTSALDPQLFASLLPNLVQLYELAASGVDAARQHEIARLASSIRDSLAEARKQATEMQGADLTLEDQEELIAILENELLKRRGDPAVTDGQG